MIAESLYPAACMGQLADKQYIQYVKENITITIYITKFKGETVSGHTSLCAIHCACLCNTETAYFICFHFRALIIPHNTGQASGETSVKAEPPRTLVVKLVCHDTMKYTHTQSHT